MRRLIRVALPVAVMSIAFACGGGGQSESQKAASPAAAPNAKKVDQATAGRISGKVLVDGTLPPNPVIKMASDPVCLHANPNGLTDQSYVTSNGGLENVFVYIKDGLGQEYVFETPTSPVTLDQKGCTYHPHVLGVRVGQPVQIVNSDDTLHNVHAMPETNQEFNYGQPINGMKSTVTFTQPEVMIPIKCDVHNWMHAYIGVVSHPYFAVTGDGGTFDLRDVPPGTYTIEAWHEKLGTLTQTVTLGPKDQKQVTFTFKASAASGN